MMDHNDRNNHNDGDVDGEADGATAMDALDRLIVAAARDYNRPPPPAAVPRDAMWAAIVAERAAGARAPEAIPLGVAPLGTIPLGTIPLGVARASRARRAARWLLAASVLLATGVGIGRWSTGAPEFGDVGGQSASRAVAARSGPDAPAADSAGLGASVRRAPSTLALADARAPRGFEGLDVGRRAGQATRVAAGRELAASAGLAAVPEGTYDDAAVRHFTAAEALLVAFRREPAPAVAALSDSLAAALDVRLSAWARQLLQDTRLLLDSPAGADPRRRQLLEDLELVLAQITRLGAAESARPAGGVAERELIDGTIKRGQVLTRLRNNVPAGT